MLFRKIKQFVAHKPKVNKIAKAEMDDFVWLYESEEELEGITPPDMN